MRLNEDYMIERLDERNIALWKVIGKAKKRSKSGRQRYGKEWKPIRYYPTIEKAIRGACTLAAVGKITFAGDLEMVLDEIKKCRQEIDAIAKNIAAQMKNKEI